MKNATVNAVAFSFVGCQWRPHRRQAGSHKGQRRLCRSRLAGDGAGAGNHQKL